jgi:hypothetical protein
MFTHPYIGSQLAHERQRDMLAQASRQRQLRDMARASRDAEETGRRPRRTWRTVLRLGTPAPA